MEYRKNNYLLLPKAIIDRVEIKPFQPRTSDIVKSYPVSFCIDWQGIYNRIYLGQKIISQARPLVIIPFGCPNDISNRLGQPSWCGVHEGVDESVQQSPPMVPL